MLVADDDPVHRGLLQDLLSPLGFIVFTATDGDDCLRMAAECRPDLLLVDISMPGLNGWEVAERLRRDGFDRLRSSSSRPTRANCARRPARRAIHDDVLAKPIGPRRPAGAGSPPAAASSGPRRTGRRAATDTDRRSARSTPPTRRGAARARLHRLRPRHPCRLDPIEQEAPEHAPHIARLRQLVSQFQIEAFMDALGPATGDDEP